jgi:hypothetical protein
MMIINLRIGNEYYGCVKGFCLDIIKVVGTADQSLKSIY